VVDRTALATVLQMGFSRVTGPRKTVVEAVVVWEGHFSAEELCRSIPQVGRATVYRTLASLQQDGVICRLMINGRAPRYLLGGTQHHHHMVCNQCGSVQDITGCGVDDFVDTVAQQHGYKPDGHRLEIYGRCSSCTGEEGAY